MLKKGFKMVSAVFSSQDSHAGRSREKDGQCPISLELARVTERLRETYEAKCQENKDLADQLAAYKAMAETLCKEKESQASQLRGKMEEIQKMDNQLAESKKTTSSLSSQLQEQKTLFTKQASQVKKQTVQLEGNQRKMASMDAELSKAKEGMNGWKQRSDYFAGKTSELSTQLDDSNKKVETVTAELRIIQSRLLEQAEVGGAPPEEDNRVREVLRSFYAKVRSWAKRYAVPSMAVALESLGPNRQSFSEHLGQVSSFQNVQDLLDLKHPFLILSALLAEALRRHVFDNPFLLFSWAGQNGELAHCADHLNIVYRKLLETNKPEAHTLRTQILRTMFPESSFNQTAPNPSFITREAAAAAYGSIAVSFWQFAGVLIHLPDSTLVQQCYDELHRIVEEAGAISGHLGTQRISYAWERSATLLGQPFDVHSEGAQADKLNKLDDEEDDRCNGMPIKIVLTPFLTKCGNSDGEKYDEGCIVAKARVWIDDRGDGDLEDEL